jgi:hypothetical protein
LEERARFTVSVLFVSEVIVILYSLPVRYTNTDLSWLVIISVCMISLWTQTLKLCPVPLSFHSCWLLICQ